MILKKLYHGNLKVCQPKNLLLLTLLTIVFLHQLTVIEIQISRKVLKTKNATFTPRNRIDFLLLLNQIHGHEI